MKFSVNMLYGFAALFGLMGVFLLIVPFVGIPLLGVGWLCHAAATKLKREARAQAVRRQLGG